MNPSAARMFPDLRSQGLNHAWLAGLTETVRGLTDGSQKLVVREIEAGERWYRQEIYYIPETARVRIYGSDITERKRAEEAMVRRTEELAQFNAAAVGRELRMIELKQQVNELARQLGQPLPYALEFEDTETPARDPNTLAHPAMAESKSSPPMNSIESA